MVDEAIVALQVLSDGMMQEAVNKLVAGLFGGLIAWYVRKKYYERSDRYEKLEKTYQAMFGVDDVDTMEGVIEVMEAHEEDIEEIFSRLEEGRQKRQEIEQKLTNLKDRISDRHNGSDSFGD